MKYRITTSIIVAAIAVPMAFAAEKEAGKESDAAKNPAPVAEKRATGEPAKNAAPGKASDAVVEKTAAHQFEGKVLATNEGDQTITVEDKNSKTHKIHVGTTTMVKKGDAEAKFSDIKVGQTVMGTCVQRGEMAHAKSVTIGG